MLDFKNLPIRRKLTLIILITSAASLLLVSGAITVYEVMRFRHRLARELSTEAEIVAANSATAMAFSDKTAAAEILRAFEAQPAIIQASLFTTDGQLFAEYRNRASSPLVVEPPGHRFEKGHVLVFREVRFNGEPVGRIGLRCDLREENAQVQASASIAVVALLAAMLVALILSIRLQRLISSPILELAQMAHEVTLKRNYSLRASKRGGDEIGVLVEQFNQMLIQIEKRDADLSASEERFRQLAENINEVFWITNISKTEVVYISPAYETIWGRSCQSVYDSPSSWLESIHEEDRERVLRAVAFQKTGKYDETYRVVRQDGSVRWIHDRGFPVRDQKGEIYRIAGIAEDITKSKEVEAALERMEANYRSIFENAVDGIFQTSQGGRYLTVNPAMARMLGYDTPKELINRIESIGTDLCVRPESRRKLHDLLIEKGEVREFENQLYRKDGSIIWISVTARVVRDADGKVLYYEGTTKDITAHKRASQQAEVFSSLASGLSAATTAREAAMRIMDAADSLFQWEGGYVHLIDPDRNCVIPILTFDIVNGKRAEIQDDQLRVLSPLTRLLVKKGSLMVDSETRSSLPVALSRFGDTSRQSNSMMFASIRQGSEVVGVLSIQRYGARRFEPEDLKLLQALADHCGGALQRIRATEQLREAEAKYRKLFENAAGGIFQVTPQGKFLSANPALARMFGYASTEEMISSVTSEETYVFPEKRNELKRMLDNQESVHGFEAERYRKDGSKFWISVNLRAVRDESGAIQYYEGTTYDVTARRHLEKQLIEISDREQSRMGQDLHDGLCQHLVRTAFAANLLEKDLSEQSVVPIEQIKKVSRLVDDAITQARNLARGLYPIKLETEGLVSAMEELAANIRTSYHVECEFCASGSILDIDHAVATHLYRIAQEAAINAAKHAWPKRIEIRLEPFQSKVRISICDDGCGISSRAVRAGGMGIHIMNYRAGMIGATIDIVPRAGGGTIVTCIFEPKNGIEPAVHLQANGHSN